ncbi:MAG TPA: hypothetical protein VGR95_07160 [Thermoanaerobaculia bacterium]|jgi:hypothetical protein|nr:hypothetical protein [Thermoanaerobaculia bacterium]
MCRLIVAAALLVLPSFAVANVEITGRLTTSSIAIEGAEKIKGDDKPETRDVHLTLGARWFQWDDGNSRGVYDFGKRMAIFVDSEKHLLNEQSLYALLSGRLAELDNRLMIGKVLKAGGGTQAAMMPATIAEHQLAVRAQGSGRSGIERTTVTGERRYVWQKKELFAYSTDLVPLPAGGRDLYVQYVRYMIGAHPEILADLQKLDGAPKWVRHTDPAFGSVQRFEIVATKETPDASYALPAMEKTSLQNPAAAAAAAVVVRSTAQSRAEATASLITQANAAAEGGKPLEAILGYLEHNLATGGMLGDDFKRHRDRLVADENVKVFLASLAPQNAEAAKAAIATLTRLAPLAGPKAYVLGIFRADSETNLGNREAAVDLFTAALKENPFLTGVWKDLGDALDTGYDAADSWRCYEVARIIAPTHNLLTDIARREAALAKEHPEFF